MSTWRYFVTDEQLEAKKWRTVEEAKSLKSRLALLEDELKKFASSWLELGHLCAGASRWSFAVGEHRLRVLNPSQDDIEIADVPWSHFDAQTIRQLIGDIQKAAGELEQKRKTLKEAGIDFNSDFAS